MPKAGPDSRLLENLLKAEKTAQDSFKQWTKDASNASVALSAWAVADSGETPDLMETSMRIGTLLGTCAESQRTYIDALSSYRASLRDVLMREADIRTILRDREILVSRLITLSKKKASDSNRESHAARLEEAQRELGACEATLKAEEWGLVGVKRRVLRDAFGMRMRSLGELGVVLEESAKSAIELLDQLGVERPEGAAALEDFRSDFAAHLAQHEHDYPPEQDNAVEGSIAPSQSASQVARRAAGYAASQSDDSEMDVHVPPAHMIGQIGGDDHLIPTATRRASAQPIVSVPPPRVKTPEPDADSSDEEKEYRANLVAHEGGGAAFASRGSKVGKIKTPKVASDDGSDTTQKASGRGFWSSFTALFKNRPPRSVVDSDDDEPRASRMSMSQSGKWNTRTDTNLKVARRNTVVGVPVKRSKRDDSSDEEIDPKTLVRVVNNVGLPRGGAAQNKRDRRSSIAAEIYNPPMVPSRPQKAMSDIGPPRQGIMKKTEPVINSGADLSRSNTVTTVASGTSTVKRKKKKRVVSEATIPEEGAAAANSKTLSPNDARWSTGTWVQKQPAAKASNSLMGIASQDTVTMAGQPVSRTYQGTAAASAAAKPKKKKAITASASAPNLPTNTLSLPTAPPRIGLEGLPVLPLPSAPPRISALDIAPSLPEPNGVPASTTSSMLAPPIAHSTETSTLGRRKSVRIADDSAPPSQVGTRPTTPAPPILRAASPIPPANGSAGWSSRIGQDEGASSDEEDQGAQGVSEYMKARRAMARAATENALSDKAKGKQKEITY